MKVLNFLFVFLICFVLSCSKEDDVEYISDNIAPPDNTIEEVTLKNYINKLYIGVLGRKATEIENEAGLSMIQNANASMESRQKLVSEILAKSEYFGNEHAIMEADFLNGVDSSEISQQIKIIKFSITTTVDPIVIEIYQGILTGLENLLAIENDMKLGTKNMIAAHKVIVNNYVYDEINMGSENYIVSLFQNFLLRYPSTAELEAGKNIVDGKPDIFFLSSANTKTELIDLFFDSPEYFEGQVRSNFLRFLYREPSSSEVSSLASKYKSNKDFKALQAYILTTDEYLGIK